MRFSTEFFRGDRYRGENILWGFSWGQVLSMMLFVVALVSCSLPQKPSHTMFSHIEHVGSLKVYTIKSVPKNKRRTLIFVAFDDMLQKNLKPLISDAYPKKHPPTLEKIVFWKFAKRFQLRYHTVIVIPQNFVTFESLKEAIILAEKLSKPYDLFLLLHGFPNRLLGSKLENNSPQNDGFLGYHQIDYKNFRSLKNLVHSMDLVFLQGCYSHTLSKELLDMGAAQVISFKGKHPNFFFGNYFYKEWVNLAPKGKLAYTRTLQMYKMRIQYNLVMRKILNRLGVLDINKYLAQLEEPIYEFR
jgi:hypothetical protein